MSFRIVAGAVIAGALSTAQAADTSLRMTSDPLDLIGRGNSYLYTAGPATFEVGFNPPNLTAVRVTQHPDGWYLQFGAPFPQPLTVGTYRNARRPFNDDQALPNMDVSGNSSGCNAFGDFQVKQVSYVGSTGVVNSLWLTFEQHCEGLPPALYGDLRVNADVVVAVTAPLRRHVERTHIVEFDVAASDVQGRHVTLSALNLPQGAVFNDHGNNTGTFTWFPEFDQAGSYEVSFVGNNGQGNSDTSRTLIDVLGTNSLVLDSDPGDEVGRGGIYSYTLANGWFRSRPLENDAGVSFQTPTHGTFWDLSFAAPYQVPIVVGAYPNATGYPYENVGDAGLGVFGSVGSCGSLTGAFDVKEIQYGPFGVSKYWAAFELHCHGNPPALRGEIRFNADVPLVLTAPTNVEASEGREVSFDVSAIDDPSGSIALAMTELPPEATFTEHADNTGTFRWTPPMGQLGPRTMHVTAHNDRGDADALPTRVMVRLAADDFDRAITIPTVPFTSEPLNTSTASRAADDPHCGGASGTVWYDLTPTADAEIRVDTSQSGFAASVSVFTGARGSLQTVVCGSNPTVSFTASAGETYHLMFGNSPAVSMVLRFSVEATAARPANDDFANATVIDVLPFSETIETTSATSQTLEPYGCGGNERTVWYKITLDDDAVVTASTRGSDYFAVINVYTANLGYVTCDVPDATFQGAAGATYYFMIDSYFGPGPLVESTLRFSVRAEPPLSVTAGIDAAGGAVDPRTGSASITGTVTCTRPSYVYVGAEVHQGAVQGTVFKEFSCRDVVHWRAPVTDANGRFQAGTASVDLNVFAYDDATDRLAEDSASGTTHLLMGRLQGVKPTVELKRLPPD